MQNERLGDAPIEAQVADKMNTVAGALDEYFNGEAKGGDRKTGFVLMVFPYGDSTGSCNYISNGADRRAMVKMLREQANRFEELDGTDLFRTVQKPKSSEPL